ncbi:MAG: hypothetical protein AAF698_13145, partial [Pseudomonadota bacterium]
RERGTAPRVREPLEPPARAVLVSELAFGILRVLVGWLDVLLPMLDMLPSRDKPKRRRGKKRKENAE